MRSAREYRLTGSIDSLYNPGLRRQMFHLPGSAKDSRPGGPARHDLESETEHGSARFGVVDRPPGIS